MSFFKRKIETKGWLVSSWDVEFLHILDKNGISIKEVTVEWDDKDISQSKGGYISKYFRESRDMLREIITVKLNDVRGQYN
ncbi:hypothetical protein A2141_00085 [Candidatus Woesebacteria bacterium RBG_16_40_11]|nr:MAG: hypothetical protein A2141_00085 [Candidatus Woesebacteria bacterium RBG_16_40_11]